MLLVTASETAVLTSESSESVGSAGRAKAATALRANTSFSEHAGNFKIISFMAHSSILGINV